MHFQIIYTVTLLEETPSKTCQVYPELRLV